MKLTVLFIVMQLLTLQVIRANDLSLEQQELGQSQEVGQQQEVEQQQEVQQTPCMQQCVEDMVLAADRPPECQRYERAFDCSLYCVLKAPIY